ncbi:hypothetical protein D6810_03205 [Candidatus Dojkabacteria bacterium]|uniref:Cell division protein FtsL n=1 Tax=Candidatus Dojkabacteria bacterium TaxID=2099670 RepID=A0A3M0YZ38_9BACT|nr:MAG: hypothetical protein D6810_03205 [Candidatus Dojkabacteria bacterium]
MRNSKDIRQTSRIAQNFLVYRLIAVNIVLFSVYILIQVFITSQVGTKSREIDLLRQEKARLRTENEFLKSEIQKESSLSSAMGLVEKYSLEKKDSVILDVSNLDRIAKN